jgi:hypothetical protein
VPQDLSEQLKVKIASLQSELKQNKRATKSANTSSILAQYSPETLHEHLNRHAYFPAGLLVSRGGIFSLVYLKKLLEKTHQNQKS